MEYYILFYGKNYNNSVICCIILIFRYKKSTKKVLSLYLASVTDMTGDKDMYCTDVIEY